MDLIARKKALLMAQPHPVILSNVSVANFSTDITGVMEITGSGNIITSGSNMIDDSKRLVSSTSVYIGNTTNGYAIPLKAGTYTFSCEIADDVNYYAYIREQNASSAQMIWGISGHTTSASFTLASNGIYRINIYLSSGINKNKVGRAWLNYGGTAEAYATYTGEKSAVLIGRKSVPGTNNVWSDSGNITVKYWTH